MEKKNLRFFVLLISIVLTVSNAFAVVFPVLIPADAGPGTLRDAIMMANATPGNDLIVFAMPPGLQTIIPLSPLPPLTDPMGVTIDGFTQAPGGSCGPMPPATAISFIQISGFAAGPSQGLWIMSDNNVIQGLIINNFQQDGILIQGGIANPTANFNVVRCCYIGVDQGGGADMGNGTNLVSLWAGVRITTAPPGLAQNNLIETCLISGNYSDGVSIIGAPPGDVSLNRVIGNYIGTDRAGGADLGNDNEGVSLSQGTHDNLIRSNIISGNDLDGISVRGAFAGALYTINNLIDGNTIGLSATSAPLPNSFNGVAVGAIGPALQGYARDNRIGPNNIIAANGRAGVFVWEDGSNAINGDENLISTNSIYGNGGLGIDLQMPGVNPNDPLDPDFFANQEMNYPMIDSAQVTGGVTTIFGRLDFPVPPSATVEVFKAQLDPSGYGEGAVYLASATPAGVGTWTVSVLGLINGDSVTATAYDGVNNTSEFGKSRRVTCCKGIRGDVNYDGTDANILDLTFTVDRVFRGGPPAPCPGEGDVNGDGTPTNILDLTFLVDRIFRAGPPPGPCL